MSEIDPPVSWEEQQYLDVKHENQALRDENARLRECELDAKRYRRLQVLGCATSTSKQLENGTVLCFTNLDEFVDVDIKAVPSRGEAALTPQGGKGGANG